MGGGGSDLVTDSGLRVDKGLIKLGSGNSRELTI